MKKYTAYLFFIIINVTLSTHTTQKAVVVVPVADLIGVPVRNTNTYHTLPLCGGKIKPFEACLRMNQLLFNVIVEVLEKRNNQVKIRIPHLFFTTKTNNKPHTTYWTHANNIISLNALQAKQCSTNKIPQPFNFKHKSMGKATHNTIVLLKPYYDKKTGYHFSAGTRFVKTNKKNTKCEVYAFDRKKMEFKTIVLPKNICLVESQIKTQKQRTQLFVQLLRSWTHLNNGTIAYVWGGCSFVHASKDPGFLEKVCMRNNKPAYSFFTKSDCNNNPKTGLDCTGLIARAAQIAGIPYFLKNSTTIAQQLQPLKEGQSIEEGDIIWIERHAMIVSNLKKNFLIEARGYSHGYGIVHEIPLHKQFKNVTTYKKLTDIVLNKKKVSRINKNGKIVEVIPQVRVFKLASTWRQNITA